MLLKERQTLPPISESVADARHFLTLWLDLAGCTDQTVEDASLLVSELATNAVQHAATPFAVGFRVLEHAVTVEVTDDAGGEPALRDGFDRGRGLEIVDAVSVSWGMRREEPGTTVFFELPC